MKHKDPYFLSRLQLLQYDILYGKNYLSKLNNYTSDKSFSLGLFKPEIENVEQLSDNLYEITGKHFTQSCRVIVDGTVEETIFADETKLLVTDADIDSHSIIRIGVESNSSTHKILTKSAVFYMSKEDDPDQNIIYDPGYFREDDVLQEKY